MGSTAQQDRSVQGGGRVVLTLASVVVVVAGLKLGAQLLVPFFLSIFLAVLSLPLLAWLQAKRIPKSIAVLLTVLTVIAVLAGLGFLVGGSVADFTAQVPKYQARLREMTEGLAAWLRERGVETSRFIDLNLINPGAVMGLLGGTLRGVAGILSNIFLVLLTVVFILLEATTIPEKLRSAFGSRGSDFDRRFNKIRREVQHYLGIKTLVSLATGGLVALWVGLWGVDFPLLWGLVAFLFNYIPNLGSILAAVPAALFAWLELGFSRAVIVALGYLAVNFLLGNLVEPQLMGRRLGLSTLVIFLSLIFWGWVWGPVGMLLSVPLTMIVKIMMEHTRNHRWIAVLLDAAPASPPAAKG